MYKKRKLGEMADFMLISGFPCVRGVVSDEMGPEERKRKVGSLIQENRDVRELIFCLISLKLVYRIRTKIFDLNRRTEPFFNQAMKMRLDEVELLVGWTEADDRKLDDRIDNLIASGHAQQMNIDVDEEVKILRETIFGLCA